jgi:hypothetical protein
MNAREKIEIFWKKHGLIFKMIFPSLYGAALFKMFYYDVFLTRDYLSVLFDILFLGIISFVYLIVPVFLISEPKSLHFPFRMMRKKYRGLVVAASLTKKTEKELRDRIDEACNSTGHEKTRKMEELFSITGIGQTLKAIVHHHPKLKVCWVLYTKESEGTKNAIEYFVKKICGSHIIFRTHRVENPYDPKDTYDKVSEIYKKECEKLGLRENEVIVDITGGTAPMSCGMMVACTPYKKMEYLNPDSREPMEIEFSTQGRD